MKKILRALSIGVLLFALVFPVQAANYYFDYVTGDDTTGDGSTGNPWKTIDKCTTSRADGDECRGAKTTINTLSGTLTFTNGSTSVTTSEDQTAVVAAGDLVSKNTGLEGWWEVASVAAGSITLQHEYWGIGTSGAAVTGYSVTPTATGNEIDIYDSNISISGGWDLSGPTQDGWTALVTTYTYGFDFGISKTNVGISKFIIFANCSYFLSASSGYDISFSDIHIVNSWSLNAGAPSWSGFNYTDVTVTGGTATGLLMINGSTFDSVYIYSNGTGLSDWALGISNSTIAYGNDIRIYNGISYAISHNGNGRTYFKNTVIDTIRTSSYSDGIWGATNAGELILVDSTISGLAGDLVYTNTGYVVTIRFIGGTASYGDDPCAISSTVPSTNPRSPRCVLAFDSTDPISYWYYGSVEQDSSAECRSGSCLYVANLRNSGVEFPVSVGVTKIPSAATDLTLAVYVKKDGSFTGNAYIQAHVNSKVISTTEISPTTSWAQYDVVIDASDLVVDTYAELFVSAKSAAGGLYIDDYSASQ